MSDYRLAIDVESAGIDPTQTGIVELCMKLYNGVVKIQELKGFIDYDPSLKIDLGALQVNKREYNSLKVNKQTAHFFITIKDIVDFLASMPKDVTLLGHNVRFDFEFLKAYLERNNVTGLERILSYRKILDTCVLGKFLNDCGILKTNSSLKELAVALEVPVNDALLHTAEGDVDLTVQVYWAMVMRVKDLVSMMYNHNS
jgi:DNA polymerase III alpha subunit (gram-positive type)